MKVLRRLSFGIVVISAIVYGYRLWEIRDPHHAPRMGRGTIERYVELNCKNDMTVFMSSGFQPLSIARPGPQALPPASILRVDPGPNSGQMQPVVKPLPKARSYTLQYAQAQAGTSPLTWTAVTFTAATKAPMITGLTPGASYVFQVRALGRLGSTGWSDPITRICM